MQGVDKLKWTFAQQTAGKTEHSDVADGRASGQLAESVSVGTGLGGDPLLEAGAAPDRSLLLCIDGLVVPRQRNNDAQPGVAADFAAQFLTFG